jgi:hypothetical protein
MNQKRDTLLFIGIMLFIICFLFFFNYVLIGRRYKSDYDDKTNILYKQIDSIKGVNKLYKNKIDSLSVLNDTLINRIKNKNVKIKTINNDKIKVANDIKFLNANTVADSLSNYVKRNK